jgi:hypothetical protein
VRLTTRVPTKLKLLDYAALADDLLIACIDDAHAAGETEALKIWMAVQSQTKSRRNIVQL